MLTTSFSDTLQQWSDGLFFTTDSHGKEQLLDNDGVQVMMEWEKPWMEDCVDALKIDGQCDVLEIGFGCGYSAERIQLAGPRSHTIFECSKPVLERLHMWAADRPNVIVVEGTWQTRLPELGVFDRIFFDDYARLGREDDEMSKCPNQAYIDVYNNTEQHFNGFVNIAFRWHARKGTMLSGYITGISSVDELPRNVYKIRSKVIRVEPPRHCNYFFGEGARVPLFSLVSENAKMDIRTRRKYRVIKGGPTYKHTCTLSRMTCAVQRRRHWAASHTAKL